MTTAGTPLNSHQQTSVHALLMKCPHCYAQHERTCRDNTVALTGRWQKWLRLYPWKAACPIPGQRGHRRRT